VQQPWNIGQSQLTKSRMEVDSRRFRSLYFDCRLLAEERAAISTYSVHR